MSTMPEKTNNTNNTKKKLTRVRKTGGIRKRPNARRSGNARSTNIKQCKCHDG